MGFSSGTDIAITVAEAVKKHVADAKARHAIYKALVDALESADWDCQNEAEGIDPVLDKLLGLEDES